METAQTPLFLGSTVLIPESSEKAAQIQAFLESCFQSQGQSLKSLRLLFRASEHSFTAEAFHKACDGKGPTLVLIKNEQGTVLGGFAGESWFSEDDPDKSMKAAAGSFLFSIDRKSKHPLKKNSPDNEREYAIVGRSDRGPMFGSAYFAKEDRYYADLVIGNSCKQHANSWADNFGATYALPKDMEYRSSEARKYLSGVDGIFQVEEYEVYAVELD